MLIDDPNIVIVRSARMLEPVAEGIPATEAIELTAVALRLKMESSSTSRLARVEDAAPSAVATSPLALSVKMPVDKLRGPRLVENESNEFVTS